MADPKAAAAFIVEHHIQDYPFGDWKEVTIFEAVGKFHPSKWGPQWRVCVVGEPNKYGGPPEPRVFATEAEAWAFINEKKEQA